MTYEPITLKDGLILRAATAKDIEAIAEFNATLHADPSDGPEEGNMLRQWTRDIAADNHPTAGDPALYTVVIDPAKENKIVSTMCMIPQTWEYDGVPFKVGRPELVGTLEEYRHRSLVRAQFDWHHKWCDDNGVLVQGITGIPYFYRLFGYEYALNLDSAIRAYEPQLPLKLQEDEKEPCAFRDATVEDIAFLMECDKAYGERNLIAVSRDETHWQYEIEGMHPTNIYNRQVVIISVDEKPVGFYIYPTELYGGNFSISRFELLPDTPMTAKIIPAVLRNAWQRGKEMAEGDENKEIKGIRLSLGENHPAQALFRHWFKGGYRPYSWYIRVSDLPKFFLIIAPALEKRLENSLFHGYTGDLKLNFYKDGVKVVLDNGKIVSAEPWRESKDDKDSARFPNLTFLQLLFGFRSMKEINHMYPDCYARNAEQAELLKVLFPKKKNEELWMVA